MSQSSLVVSFTPVTMQVALVKLSESKVKTKQPDIKVGWILGRNRWTA